jgi:Putative transposase
VTRHGRGRAVTAIQRFGSALNLNVHFHKLAVQGVFVDDGAGGPRFVPNPEPSDLEVAKLLASIGRRITHLAKRHGIE